MQFILKELKVKEASAVYTGVMEKVEGLSFDISKHIRFVHVLIFSETKVDKYFLHFEKVACSLK